MPKMKTNKSASKRFRLTSTGKVMFRHTSLKKKKISKSPGQKRRLYLEGVMDASKQKMVGRQIPYGA